MERLWEQALGSLKTHLSTENFETWLEPVQFGGKDLTAHVKFSGEDGALYIVYVYADIYVDGEITRNDILFQKETPISKEEYDDARADARSQGGQ